MEGNSLSMHSTLSARIDALPEGALDSLRARWPGVVGGLVPVGNGTYTVFIVAPPDIGASMAEVVTEADRVFGQHGLAGFIKARNVLTRSYSFRLVETLDRSDSPPVKPL